jgi:hypothetical protein
VTGKTAQAELDVHGEPGPPAALTPPLSSRICTRRQAGQEPASRIRAAPAQLTTPTIPVGIRDQRHLAALSVRADTPTRRLTIEATYDPLPMGCHATSSYQFRPLFCILVSVPALLLSGLPRIQGREVIPRRPASPQPGRKQAAHRTAMPPDPRSARARHRTGATRGFRQAAPPAQPLLAVITDWARGDWRCGPQVRIYWRCGPHRQCGSAGCRGGWVSGGPGGGCGGRGRRRRPRRWPPRWRRSGTRPGRPGRRTGRR